MRQVPCYLIIGNGRVAKHFCQYFNLLGLSYYQWHRQCDLADLYLLLPKVSHVLLLIADQAIVDFSKQYLKNSHAIKIHCSGSLYHQDIYGAHPLMTFSCNFFSLIDYQSIPFVVDEKAPECSILLPGLPNVQVRIASKNKAKYHALCVMAGNFTCLLWQKLFASFEQELNFPKSLAWPYLQQQMKNLIAEPDSALTGPIVRGDKDTIAKNIAALEGDGFQEIYKSFVAQRGER